MTDDKRNHSDLLQPPRVQTSLLTDQDLHLFNEGTHYRIYNKLGAHLTTVGGQAGNLFCGVGAECEVKFPWWATSIAGTRNPSAAVPRQFRHLGRIYSRGRQRRALQVPHRFPQSGIRRREGRSLWDTSRKASAHRFGSLGSGIPMGRSEVDGNARQEEIRCRRRFQFMKFTWARGCGCRKRATVR